MHTEYASTVWQAHSLTIPNYLTPVLVDKLVKPEIAIDYKSKQRMKTTVMTVALLLVVASVSALAQAGGKTSGRYPTPTAEGSPSSGQSSQSATSGQKNESTMSTGSTHSKTGTEISKSQSNGHSGQSTKAGDNRVNQRAAGVPKGGGSTGSTSTKPTKKQ